MVLLTLCMPKMQTDHEPLLCCVPQQDLRDLFRLEPSELDRCVTQAQLHAQHAHQRSESNELAAHLRFLETLPGFLGGAPFSSWLPSCLPTPPGSVQPGKILDWKKFLLHHDVSQNLCRFLPQAGCSALVWSEQRVGAGVSDHHLLFSDKEEHVGSHGAPSSSSRSAGVCAPLGPPRQRPLPAAAQRRAAPPKSGAQ